MSKLLHFKSQLNSLNFVAIDFETANEMRASACSFGYAVVENGQIQKSGQILIKPPVLRVSEINRKIHGLTEEVLADKSEFNEVWPEIEALLTDQIVVAHNCDFDIDVLNQTCRMYGLDRPDFLYMCSQKLAQEAFPDQESFRLKDLAHQFGITLNHHNSQSDAEVSAEITIRALNSACDFKFPFSHLELTKHIKKRSSGRSSKSMSEFFGGNKLKGDILKPNLDAENKEHPFYNKAVVFTGVLDTMSREEAAAKIQVLGANINTTISKKTNYVIGGDKMGPSKYAKIVALQGEGYPIQLLDEKEFLNLLSSKPETV